MSYTEVRYPRGDEMSTRLARNVTDLDSLPTLVSDRNLRNDPGIIPIHNLLFSSPECV